MSCRQASRVAIVLLLTGCSGLAQRDPDPTPINPTAVVETHLVSEGIRDFPAFDTTTRLYTRSSMRRSESTTGGTFARLLGSANADARIERLDRKLAWTLDPKNKRYTECPLKGCPGPIPKKPPQKPSADTDRGTECRLKIGNSTVSVEPTGQKRSINGFDTDQYDIKWLATFRDNASRKSTSTVSIDLWTTPVTPAMKDAMALQRTYARAQDKILGIETNPDRLVILPPEVGKMISDYLTANVSPATRENFLEAAKKLDKVKGQPILVNVKWTFTGEACSMDETMKDIGDSPLFAFTSEVRAYRLEALHDSLFSPPKDFKRVK